MDNILASVMKSEKAARALVAEAEAVRARLDEDVAAELAQYRAAALAAADEKLAKLSAEEGERLNASVGRLKAETERSKENMRVNLEKSGDKWAKELFNEIIGK